MEYLSQEWLDLQRQLQSEFRERPGATARVQYKVTGGPAGEVRYYASVVDGRMVEQRLGTDPEADVSMSTSWDDSVAMLRGELDPGTAMMQGRITVTGNRSRLAPLMPITQTAAYREHYTELLRQTRFPST